MATPARWIVWSYVAAFLWSGPGEARCDPPVGQEDRAADVPLHRTATGHLVVRASASGRPLWLVVDTASPATLIDQGTPRKLGAPAAPDGRPAVTGVVSGLRIGGALLGDVPVRVARLDTVLGKSFGAGGGAEADGILGADLLAQHGALIDLGRRTLLLDPTPGHRKALAQQAAREGRTPVEIADTTGRHPAVPCILGNDPYRLVVDTGSPHTVVQRAVVDPSDLARPSRQSAMHTLSGVTQVSWVPLQHWSIGAFPVTGATVGAGDFQGGVFDERTASGGQVVGLLGLEWLVHWGAIIDFGSRTIYLKHP